MSVLGVLAIAGVVGAIVLTNILRGGADSPEQAVTKSLEAVTNKDLVGLFTMVSPHERDAVMRVQDAVVKKVKDEGIADAAKSVSTKDSADAGSELVFDGVDVTFSGINPSVSQVSEDVAVVHISSGEIKLHVDPAQTKGAIRSFVDNFENASVTDQTLDISDLGPSNSGLSLLATKKDGRWYINVAGSVLEAVNSYQATPRGFIPASSQTGGDSPQSAAKSAVQASQSQTASQVAPFLVKDEANILYLYGHLWNKVNTSSSSKFSFGNVDFTEGPREGNRAQAYVSQINVSTGSSDKFTLTDKCFKNSSSSQDGNCLNGSAYQTSGYGYGEINWVSALLSHDGKFALTTVNEDGKWRVSVLDSAADHLVSAVKSLTHEQSLAVSSLARSQAASGSISLGESKDLDFNNAGYAVSTLKLEEATKLQLENKSTLGAVRLYSADGKEEKGGVATGDYNSVTFEPGEYKVMAWAGSEFRDAARTGKSAGLKGKIHILEYVEPATISGSKSVSSTYISSSSKSFSVTVPTDRAGALLLKPTSGTSSGIKIVATINGKSYDVDPTVGKSTGIPVGVGSHTLMLDVESTSSKSYFSGYAYLDLSYENQ
ncbi:hypothetical protein [Pseudarthrobacter sp. S6]|uniref:hypothetical protein n=1 Tax=Pseudarthrobacter sp. S6 TaxID=3418420 RepID=UPI003CE86CA4